MSRPRVLVVDDDPLMGAALRLSLTARVDVEVVTSGEAALVAVGEQHDAVILDVRLGGMGGYATCAEIRRRHPDVPVIFHSAYPMAIPPQELINRYHPFGYLTKGGEAGELERLVDEAINLRTFIRALRGST